jgi:hypothetical protein
LVDITTIISNIQQRRFKILNIVAPSIAPSGMAFISSDIYPNWKEFTGSLKFQYVEMLTTGG